MINELLNLIAPHYPELSIRLNLQACQAINNLIQQEQNELEDLAYEFMSNSFSIFEEDLQDTEQKVPALNLIVATLYTLQCFGADNFETLVSNAISYSNKLLKKNMQCEATTTASHLYYCNFQKHGNKVMDVLRKSLKMADSCMSKKENLYLFVQILNSYIYYLVIQSEFMNPQEIITLCNLIHETISDMEDVPQPAKDAIKAL